MPFFISSYASNVKTFRRQQHRRKGLICAPRSLIRDNCKSARCRRCILIMFTQPLKKRPRRLTRRSHTNDGYDISSSRHGHITVLRRIRHWPSTRADRLPDVLCIAKRLLLSVTTFYRVTYNIYFPSRVYSLSHTHVLLSLSLSRLLFP